MLAYRLPARQRLDADRERLHRDHLVVLELTELRHLLSDPPDDPWVAARGPQRAGVDDLAATLAASRRLPADLTVRVLLPAGAEVAPSVEDAEAVLHRRAAFLSSVAWREGMAVRAMGLSQLPLGLTVAAISWAVAGIAASMVADASGLDLVVVAAIAMVGITIAWVVSWMVVESTLLDWRLAARRAAAYDLLARARLEVAVDPA